MKILNLKIVLLYLFFLVFSFSFVFSAEKSSSNWGGDSSKPTDVLDRVNNKANKEDSVQNTAIDNVDPSGSYDSDYQISNTLDWLRTEISPYLQWAVFIGLSIAVILIIYNGLLLVGGALSESVAGKVKTRLMYLSIGVVVITGFYFIIKVLISLLGNVV